MSPTGWKFRAHTHEGEMRTGTIQAASAEEAKRVLAKNKLVPDLVQRAPRDFNFHLRRRVGHKALTIYTRQFATLVESGIPMVLGLDILETVTEDKPLIEASQKVSRAVQAGSTLADAMRAFPRVFSPLYVYMVEAGEEGGHLDTTFERLAQHLEKSQHLRERVRAAMAYPLLILVVAIGAVAAMLTLVVPAFTEMFAVSGVALPYPTQVLVNSSEAVLAHWRLLIFLSAALFFVFQQSYDSKAGKIVLDVVILGIPVFGDLARKAAVARFTRTMSSLLYSGVAVLDAIRVSAKTSGNGVIERSIMKCHSSVAAGLGIADPLAATKVLPRLVAQMVRVGEETGRLDEMFGKVAGFYESEVDTTVDGLVKALEPALVVLVGVVLGGMVMAMYLPILEAITVVG